MSASCIALAHARPLSAGRIRRTNLDRPDIHGD
jgi:hypothetical protein